MLNDMVAEEGGVRRRDLLKLGAAQAMAVTVGRAWLSAEAHAQEPGTTPLNRSPTMVQESYVNRVRAIMRTRRRRLQSLATRADAEAYVADVRRRVRDAFGPFPEKTPLNPKVTGIVERDAYRIEKLLFESRPGFLVSANLYVPRGRDLPLPTVVGTCGHSENGKAAEPYQAFAQGLARQGYVVLIYDPIGQGERLQYPDEDLRSTVGAGVQEHLMAGNQQALVGDFHGTWRAWDGIRALDYLLTREEVDPTRVGVTGNSGGGTLTTWLAGVEDRWAMAAPSCFVTSFLRNLENELPADIEQCPPRALALGLDHADFLAAMAPKPVIVLAKEKDYFDVRGATRAYDDLRRIYRLLGAEENVGFFAGPTGHGYSQENREAMYRWFNGATGISDATSEPALTIEDDATLQCTPGGQVAALGSKSLPELTRERSRQLRDERAANAAPTRLIHLARMMQAWTARERPDYRILRPFSGRGYPKRHATSYAVATDPGIHVAATRLYDEPHHSRPPGDPPRAILYVSHHSADAELRAGGLAREVIEAEPGSAAYICDVRGIGESRPNTCGIDSFLDPYGNDYFYAAHGLMLDDPYPAQRTRDLMRLLDWLRSIGHREVHLVALGWGTIPGALAAWRHDLVTQVTLKNAPTSYADIAEADTYDWPLSALVPGILRVADLPDVYDWLEASKGLRQLDPVGPGGSSTIGV